MRRKIIDRSGFGELLNLLWRRKILDQRAVSAPIRTILGNYAAKSYRNSTKVGGLGPLSKSRSIWETKAKGDVPNSGAIGKPELTGRNPRRKNAAG